MRIRLAIPDRHVDGDILDAALEASTRANRRILEAGEAPSIRDAINGGMRWKPEPFVDGEHFDLAPVAASRGWGDCDDLAPWLAAEMRISGDEGATAFVRAKSPGKWHALVRTGDGRIVDPSRWAGMGQGRAVGPAVQRRMAAVGGGAMAVIPTKDGRWAARTDIPWGSKHFSGMAVSGDPNNALIQATRGAVLVGEEMGIDCSEVEQFIEGFCGDAEENPGGVVSGLFDDILGTALPIASALGVPGAGLVQTALPMAGSLLSSLTGGGGGMRTAGGGNVAPPPPPPAATVPGIPISLPQSSGGGGRPSAPMQAMPLPGGGHIAYNPAGAGPVIVKF